MLWDLTKMILNICFVLIFIGGCSLKAHETKQIDINHVKYVESYGWHIKEEKESVNHPPGTFQGDRLKLLQSGGVDLSSFNEKQIKEVVYLLQETQKHGRIFASIFEVDGKIIGGHLGLEGYSPGIAELSDKSVIMK